MPGKMALVDFNKCQAEKCGVCPAAAACPRKLLKQDKPGEPPMPDPFLCKGCSDCIRACPYKAISLVKN